MLVLLLLACPQDPISTETTNNLNVPVEVLFNHDGCTMYRFEDGGRDHYFARCPESVTTVSPQSCGKNCTRDETVTTLSTD